MFTNNERHGVYLASVLSTISLMAVVVLLPAAHQHFQRTMSIMLSNVGQCQQQSANLWHQLLISSPDGGTTFLSSSYGTAAPQRQKRRNSVDDHAFKSTCCACTQGSPGPRGQPGGEGIKGKDGKHGTLGYPGRAGKHIPAPPVEQTSCQMCHPGPPGPPGVPGPKGARGHAGHTGKAGKHGDNNHAGPPGPQGARGEPGLPGKDGPHGDRGRLLNGAAPGRPGPMGLYGPRGTPGAQGREGQSGMEGTRGMRGLSGERGDDGPLGAQGPAGMAGLTGEPAGCAHCQKSAATTSGVVGSTATTTQQNKPPVPMPTIVVAAPPKNPAVPFTPTGSTIPVPLNAKQAQQNGGQLSQSPLLPLAWSAQASVGHAQPSYKAHAVPIHYSSNDDVPNPTAAQQQFGRSGDAASAPPAIPVPIAAPGQQEPSTIMPTVISDRFVGYGNAGGGYGTAVMTAAAAAAAAKQNDESSVEYTSLMEDSRMTR